MFEKHSSPSEQGFLSRMKPWISPGSRHGTFYTKCAARCFFHLKGGYRIFQLWSSTSDALSMPQTCFVVPRNRHNMSHSRMVFQETPPERWTAVQAPVVHLNMCVCVFWLIANVFFGCRRWAADFSLARAHTQFTQVATFESVCTHVQLNAPEDTTWRPRVIYTTLFSGNGAPWQGIQAVKARQVETMLKGKQIPGRGTFQPNSEYHKPHAPFLIK